MPTSRSPHGSSSRKSRSKLLSSLSLPALFYAALPAVSDPLSCPSRAVADPRFSPVRSVQPAALLETLDTLPGKVMATVKVHLQACKQAGPSGETSKDCLRAMVKALATFHSLNGIEACAKFTHFYKQILATKVLQELLTTMQSAK
jgi:hypothetical protein